MGTTRFGAGPPPTRTDVTRAATIGDVHAVSTETTRGTPWQERGAFAGRPPPPVRRLHVARAVVAQASLMSEGLRPTERGRIGILDDAWPRGHRAAHHDGGGVDPVIDAGDRSGVDRGQRRRQRPAWSG
jgi:hypothetical protein